MTDEPTPSQEPDAGEELIRRIESTGQETQAYSTPIQESPNPLPTTEPQSHEHSQAQSIDVVVDSTEINFSIDKDGVYKTGIFKDDVKVLKAADAPKYLSDLQRRLSLAQHVVLDSRFNHFLGEILTAFRLLELNYQSQMDVGYTEVPFIIDPTDSGFPHFANFQFIIDDKEKSGHALENIGGLQAILKAASDKIAQEIFPAEERSMFGKYRYFTLASEIEPLQVYTLGEVVEEKHKITTRTRAYKTEWWGVDSRFSGFVFYKLNFNVDFDHGKLDVNSEKEQELRDTIEQTFRQPLQTVFLSLDQIAHIHPKKVTKFSIGPYFNETTINEMPVNLLFEDYNAARAKGDDDPYMLKITKQKIETLGEARKTHEGVFGFLKAMFDKSHNQVPSDLYRRDYWLAPLKIKQMLVDCKDGRYGEYDLKNVFGVTKNGALAGRHGTSVDFE